MRTVLVILSAVVTAWAQLTVNTPVGVATCQNTLLTWSGGSSDDSYIVQIARSPGGDVIQGFTGITSTSYNWYVTVPANTQAFIRILTITRKTAQSAVFTIQAGASQGCTGTTATIPIDPITVTNTNPPSTTPTVPALTTPTPTTSDSGTITSGSASGSSTIASGSLTSLGNSTSRSPGSGSSTSSDQTGAPGSTLDTNSFSSSSPNAGVIAGAAAGGVVALALLLLGICLYRRRKRSAKAAEQSHPIETKAGAVPPPMGKPYFPGYSSYSSTAPMVPASSSQYPPPTNSPDSSSAAMMTMMSQGRSQRLHSEARTTSTSGILSTTPFIPVTTTPFIPVTTTTTAAAVTAHDTAIPGPVDDSPPMYRDEDEAQLDSQRIRAQEAERARLYDALIADFCASNRDLISPALERKLHAARYLPEDNPSDVPDDYWHNKYGVEYFELKRLRTAYERNVATQALINMPEKALPQAALSAKEKAMHPYRQAGRHTSHLPSTSHG